LRQAYDYWQDQPGSSPQRHRASHVQRCTRRPAIPTRPRLSSKQGILRCEGAAELLSHNHLMHRIRKNSMPVCTTRAHDNVKLRRNTRAAWGSPECPTTSIGWKATSKPTNSRSVGMQHKNHQRKNVEPQRQGTGLRRIVCRLFGAQAQSQPTQTTQLPLTCHRMSRSQHNLANPPPKCPKRHQGNE